jgi:hypothetical protein
MAETNSSSDSPSQQPKPTVPESIPTRAKPRLSSVAIPSNQNLVRGLILGGAGVIATPLVGIAIQKWGTTFPNWLLFALSLIPLSVWVYWLWTHETIARQRRHLVYTYPRMSLLAMVAIGACLGGAFGWLLWRSTQTDIRKIEASTEALVVDAKPTLTLLRIPDGEFVFTGSEGIKLSPEFLRDRKQYRLVVENESQADLTDLKLSIQFPYAVETSFVNANYEARGVVFKPQSLEMTFQGYVESPRLFTSIYELSATELMKQKARFEVIFVLNTWHDPHGKEGREIPEGDRQLYHVPVSGPLITYIDGGFKIKAEDGRTQDEHYYTPIVLNDDKTISLGSLTEPPGKLIHRTFHITSLPPPP